LTEPRPFGSITYWFDTVPEVTQSLDELAREGSHRMIAAALEAEGEQYVESLRHLRDEDGHALVVRNGKSHHERTVHMGAGSVKIQPPTGRGSTARIYLYQQDPAALYATLASFGGGCASPVIAGAVDR
jgi:hypothetical protein